MSLRLWPKKPMEADFWENQVTVTIGVAVNTMITLAASGCALHIAATPKRFEGLPFVLLGDVEIEIELETASRKYSSSRSRVAQTSSVARKEQFGYGSVPGVPPPLQPRWRRRHDTLPWGIHQPHGWDGTRSNEGDLDYLFFLTYLPHRFEILKFMNQIWIQKKKGVWCQKLQKSEHWTPHLNRQHTGL